jgi:hypothetical protein
MEERPEVSLAKEKVWAMYEAIERNRKRPTPPPKSPLVPLVIIFACLIATVAILGRALHLCELEIASLKLHISEQAEVIKVSSERIASFGQEAPPTVKAEPLKRRPVKKKAPRLTGQNELLSGGDGPAATLR